MEYRSAPTKNQRGVGETGEEVVAALTADEEVVAALIAEANAARARLAAHKLGLSPGKRPTQKEVANALLKAGDGGVSKSDLATFVEIVPGFTEEVIATLRAIAQLPENAGASQRASLDAAQKVAKVLERNADALEKLAGNAQSDKTRVAIAQCIVECGRACVEIATKIETMNRGNNNLWTTLAVAFAAALGGAYLGNRKKRDSDG